MSWLSKPGGRTSRGSLYTESLSLLFKGFLMYIIGCFWVSGLSVAVSLLIYLPSLKLSVIYVLLFLLLEGLIVLKCTIIFGAWCRNLLLLCSRRPIFLVCKSGGLICSTNPDIHKVDIPEGNRNLIFTLFSVLEVEPNSTLLFWKHFPHLWFTCLSTSSQRFGCISFY